MAYSPSGSSNTRLRLWDVGAGQQLRRFAGQTGVVSSVAFSPDGTRALCGASDRTLRLWQTDTAYDLIAFVRANRYVPELPCAQQALYDVPPLCPAIEAAQP